MIHIINQKVMFFQLISFNPIHSFSILYKAGEPFRMNPAYAGSSYCGLNLGRVGRALSPPNPGTFSAISLKILSSQYNNVSSLQIGNVRL